MTDELLIKRLSEAMHEEVADLVVPADLLERVLARRRRSWRMPGLDWLAPALAVAVAAAVAIVAVTSLSHRPGSPAGGSAPASIPAAARGLARQLAVLRRPQRPADRLTTWEARETQSLLYGHSRLLPGLTRFVGAVNLGRFGHARVYLVVQTPPGRVLHSTKLMPPLPARGDGDLASLVFIGRIWHGESGFAVEPTVALDAPQTYLASSDSSIGGPEMVDTGLGSAASIVPDGVARVTWTFAVAGQSRRIMVQRRVHDNVVLATRLPSALVLKSAVWYRPDGEVMTSIGQATGPMPPALRRALQASVHHRVAPVLLRHFRVLRLRSELTRPPSFSLPPSLAARMVQPNPLGLNIARAWFVPIPRVSRAATASNGIWVVPGAQGIALAQADSGQSVGGGTSAALHGQLFTVTAAGPHTETVWGILPDQDRAVRVILPRGELVDTGIVDNVFSLVVPRGARTLVVTTASGRTVRLRLGRPRA